MQLKFVSTIIFLLHLSIFSLSAFANQDKKDFSDINISSNVKTIGSNSDFFLIIDVHLDKGWYSYWSNPGESGYPLNISVEDTDYFVFNQLIWTTPERIVEHNMTNYGFLGDFSVLVPVSAKQIIPGVKYKFNVKVNWLICKDICIPYSKSVAIELDGGEEYVYNQKVQMNVNQFISGFAH